MREIIFEGITAHAVHDNEVTLHSRIDTQFKLINGKDLCPPFGFYQRHMNTIYLVLNVSVKAYAMSLGN